MTAEPTFGELVVLGRRHLAAAAGEIPTVTPGRQTQQLASSLTRLVLPLRRCARDLSRTAGQDAGALAARSSRQSNYVLASLSM